MAGVCAFLPGKLPSGAMIFIFAAEAVKGLGIVSDDGPVHGSRHCCLPCVVFSHPLRVVPLALRDPVRMGPADALPLIASKIRPDSRGIVRPFQNLSPCHRTDPKARGAISLQPSDGRAGPPLGEFVQEINDE